MPPEDTSQEFQSEQELKDTLEFDFMTNTPEEEGSDSSGEESEGAESAPSDNVDENVTQEQTAEGGEEEDAQPATEENAPEVTVPDPTSEALAKVTSVLEKLTQREEDNSKESSESAPDLPQYSLSIPEKIVSAIQSEDPEESSAGISALANGLAVTIHSKMREEMTTKLQEITQNLPTQFTSYLQNYNAQRAVAEDFYGSFPEFAHPDLRETVVQVATKIAQEKGMQEWNPTFKKILAERLRALGLGAKVEDKAAQQTTTPPKLSGGSGSRPATVTKTQVQDHMQDVLDLFTQ